MSDNSNRLVSWLTKLFPPSGKNVTPSLLKMIYTYFFGPVRATCPALILPHNIWRGVPIMKLLFMQFSLSSCHFIPLRRKEHATRRTGKCSGNVGMRARLHFAARESGFPPAARPQTSPHLHRIEAPHSFSQLQFRLYEAILRPRKQVPPPQNVKLSPP
jgi:hypothetical protein